jgi:hypothetical protein
MVEGGEPCPRNRFSALAAAAALLGGCATYPYPYDSYGYNDGYAYGERPVYREYPPYPGYAYAPRVLLPARLHRAQHRLQLRV